MNFCVFDVFLLIIRNKSCIFLNGINFKWNENVVFIYFVLFLECFVNVFVGVGVVLCLFF